MISHNEEQLIMLAIAAKRMAFYSKFSYEDIETIESYIRELNDRVDDEAGTASRDNLIRSVVQYLNEQLVIAKNKK